MNKGGNAGARKAEQVLDLRFGRFGFEGLGFRAKRIGLRSLGLRVWGFRGCGSKTKGIMIQYSKALAREYARNHISDPAMLERNPLEGPLSSYVP